jgi:FkbM family methyltransferase
LAAAIDGDPAMAERSRRFTEAFLRPHGIDRPATPILAEAIRSLPAVQPRHSWPERVLCELILRPILEIMIIGQAYRRRLFGRLGKVTKAMRTQPAKQEKVKKLPRVVSVHAADKTYRFLCHTQKEVRRVRRLFSKEPGTIEWLSQTLKPDDIFFDIGANIGAYSIFAGQELAPGGRVYAFEPHLANASTLLQNIGFNGLLDRVHVISVPLADREGFGPFHYYSLESSRSYSQFGPPVVDGVTFEPAATEFKYGTRLDALLASGVIPTPTVVKVDVDGLEAEIIAGMQSLLASDKAPRSVQIELSADNASSVIDQMTAAGYELVSRHWTQSRQEAIDKGADPLAEFPHNVVFAKVTVPVERRPAALSLLQTG